MQCGHCQNVLSKRQYHERKCNFFNAVTKKSLTGSYLNSILNDKLNAPINLNFVERFVNSYSDYYCVLTHPLQNKPDPKMIFPDIFLCKILTSKSL